MARTTTRAQMLIGMMLEELDCIIGNFEEWTPATVNDRDYSALKNDGEYMRAIDVVSCLLKREIKKNEARQYGAFAGTIDDIDQGIRVFSKKEA